MNRCRFKSLIVLAIFVWQKLSNGPGRYEIFGDIAWGLVAGRLAREFAAHYAQQAFASCSEHARSRISCGCNIRDQCRESALEGKRKLAWRHYVRTCRAFRNYDDNWVVSPGRPLAETNMALLQVGGKLLLINREQRQVFQLKCSSLYDGCGEVETGNADDRRITHDMGGSDHQTVAQVYAISEPRLVRSPKDINCVRSQVIVGVLGDGTDHR